MFHFELTQLVRDVGYPGLFAAVFLESGVFFGFFLPGASMLFTAGILASQGYFDPWVLVPLISLAAILGDSAGYWFGSYVGPALYRRSDSRFFHHRHLERAHVFYEKHGVQAVTLARFIPIVRTFAPIVAGIVRMRYRTFLAYNIAGGLIWGAGLTALGYYLGVRVPLVGQYLTPVIVVIVTITCLPLLWELRKREDDRQ